MSNIVVPQTQLVFMGFIGVHPDKKINMKKNVSFIFHYFFLSNCCLQYREKNYYKIRKSNCCCWYVIIQVSTGKNFSIFLGWCRTQQRACEGTLSCWWCIYHSQQKYNNKWRWWIWCNGYPCRNWKRIHHPSTRFGKIWKNCSPHPFSFRDGKNLLNLQPHPAEILLVICLH